MWICEKTMIKLDPLKTIGDRLSYAIVINFYIWLFVAMMNGGQVTVYFNFYNEAIAEYIIYMIILPIISYSFIKDIITFRKRRKEWKKKRLTI